MEPLCRIREIYRFINDFENDFFQRYGIKLNEGMLICSLSKMERASSGEIAEALGLSLSNSSKVILSAEKKGFIHRLIGKEDKRQMFFKLTPKGHEALNNVHCESVNIEALIDKIRTV